MKNYRDASLYGHPHNVKEPATVDGQLDKLITRGLIINNRAEAKKTLEIINYYRLVNYFAVFKESKNEYKSGTTFEMGLRLYDFDRRLRSAILIVLEEIEITLRAIISNYHALKYGALGYLNPSSFDVKMEGNLHRSFINKIDRLIETNSDLNFVRHHNKNYGGSFPLWVIMELFSFGMLCYFFSDMKKSDKKELTGNNFPSNVTYRHIESWMENLTDLRNHCAHYNRLYAGLPLIKIRPADNGGEQADNSLFGLILIMKRFHKRPEIWKGVFLPLITRLFTEYADIIDLKIMGFPEDWEAPLSLFPPS